MTVNHFAVLAGASLLLIASAASAEQYLPEIISNIKMGVWSIHWS